MSASPATIGATSFGTSRPSYWLSASVLTITSAPSLSAASRPAWKPLARPLLLVSRTMWSTPCSRADLDRAVGRAVVDHEPLDHVEAGDLAGEVAQRDGERLLLVHAGDLDDELHGADGGQSYHRRRDEPPARRGPGARRARADPRRRAGPARRSTTTTGCPTSTTSTRARTSPSAPSRSSATRTPATSRTRRRTRTCCTSSTASRRSRWAAARRSSTPTRPTRRGSSRSRARSPRCCAWPASARSTPRAARCGTAAPASSPPRCCASPSCRWRSRRIALTDVGTLAPVAVVLLLSIRMREAGRPAHCAAGRRAAGLAIGFKYTAGLVAARAGARARAAAGARDRARYAPPRRRSRVARPARSCRLLRHQPVLLPRLRHRAAPAARAGRAGRQPGQVRPGAGDRRRCTTWTACLGARLVAAAAPRAGAVLLARRDRGAARAAARSSRSRCSST